MTSLMIIWEEISNFIYSNIINKLPKILKIFMTNIIMNIEQKLLILHSVDSFFLN